MKEIQRRLLPSTAALTAFEAVARLGSFSAAAEALSLTPGAISRHVDGLEGQLGVKLVSRTNKGVELTEKGRRYATGAAGIINDLRLLSLEAMSSTQQGLLNIAILPTFGTRWLLPRIPGFVSANPDITLNFVTRIGRVDFSGDRLDAAIHVGRPFGQGLVFDHLMPEIVAPVASPDFARENALTTPEQLKAMPLLEMVSRPDGWRNWFEQMGVSGSYREGMRFEQFMNVAQACMAGLGIALMPLFLIQTELEAGQLVEMDVPRHATGNGYYLVHPEGRRDERAIRRFGDWLRGEAEHFLSTESATGRALSPHRQGSAFPAAKR